MFVPVTFVRRCLPRSRRARRARVAVVYVPLPCRCRAAGGKNNGNVPVSAGNVRATSPRVRATSYFVRTTGTNCLCTPGCSNPQSVAHVWSVRRVGGARTAHCVRYTYMLQAHGHVTETRLDDDDEATTAVSTREGNAMHTSLNASKCHVVHEHPLSVNIII